MTAISYAHLLAAVLWIGGMFFFTFIGAPAIFKILPRREAGNVVGAIFPKYWALGYIAPAILIGTLLILAGGDYSTVAVPLAILLLATALSFFSGIVIGGKARRVKAELYGDNTAEAEKEELKKKFGKLHGISAVLNILVIVLSLVYLWFVPGII